MMSESSARTNWARTDHRDFESLWSMIHRFCRINLVSPVDILDDLRDYSRFEEPVLHFDLREPTRIDQEIACGLLALSERDYRRGLHAHYSCDPSDGIFDIVVARSVRLCLSCAACGFHSPMYDLLYFNRCPIHCEPFIDKCPRCSRKISFHPPRRGTMGYSCLCGYSFTLIGAMPLPTDYSDRLRRAEQWTRGVWRSLVVKVARLRANGSNSTKENVSVALSEFSPSENWFVDTGMPL